MLRARGGALVALAAMAMISCSNNDDEGGGGAGTLPTVPATSAPASTSSSTPGVASTVVASSTAAASSTVVPVSVPPGAVGLSPDGPWRLVDSAPGVTTPGLVYELMPKLWAVIQVEETEQSTYSWTLNDADRPIIEAYLQAQLTYFTAVTSNPINLDLPGWTQFYADGGAAQFVNLQARKNAGQTADLDLGVVYFPEVLSDERSETTALVADCFLDGGVFRLPDGTLAPGSTPGFVETPWATRMSLVGERWVVVEEGSIEGGCI